MVEVEVGKKARKAVMGLVKKVAKVIRGMVKRDREKEEVKMTTRSRTYLRWQKDD